MVPLPCPGWRAGSGDRFDLRFFYTQRSVSGDLREFELFALAEVKPKEKSVNPCYQCEQDQNYNMIIAEVVLFFTAAGCTWSIDHLLGIFCGV